ncbi:hypothetical protein Ahy_A08g039792 [Arachis hypogaea]|uniref:Protein FAR1-RELATED SEQUENCE n=1 Tax=Arachis hypogaea TaxID=3818 RepID=A0A445BXA6_ARAHY|nr:hypothetical protein Ahy_A08g039792 [Arachis hypogaea]
MDDSTSDYQLNQGEVDFEFESNEVFEPLCVVDDQFVPKVGMTFTTVEDAEKFYRNYAKAADFSTRVRSTNNKENEIKNQLITCSIERKWKSKISPTEKTNPTADNNKEAGIRPSKTYQSFVAVAGGHYLYEDRHIWVPIYLDHHFWARMKSTQRSESMHSFFNKFITRNSSLIQFVKQYDNCLGSREQAERESDAADFHTVIPCATKSSIEAQFQDVYTHQKFRKVQAQFRGKVSCITRLTNSALGYSVYKVGEQVFSSIFNKFMVTYNSVAAELAKFIEIILERWSKKVKRRHTHIKSSHDEPLLEPRSKRFDELVFRSRNICEFASESEELTAILHRAYDNVMVEIESLKAKRKGTSSLSHEDANLESVNELQSPPRIRTRGRPKNRLGSKLDKQIANASKKKKTKALNELNLFDAASVVRSNSNQYQGRVMNYQFREPAAADNFLGV